MTSSNDGGYLVVFAVAGTRRRVFVSKLQRKPPGFFRFRDVFFAVAGTRRRSICFEVFDFFYKKNIKNQGVSIDESLRKKYINFHRRFTAALLFDRSGKEITD